MPHTSMGGQTAETSAPASVVSLAIITVELDYQTRSDYQPVYLGTNTPGAALSDPTWNIRLITYDGSNRATMIQNATGAWTNRTSLTYD